ARPRRNQSAGAALASSLRASRRVMESEAFIVQRGCARLTSRQTCVQSKRAADGISGGLGNFLNFSGRIHPDLVEIGRYRSVLVGTSVQFFLFLFSSFSVFLSPFNHTRF